MSNLTFADVAFAYTRGGGFDRRSTAVFQHFSWRSPEGSTVILGPNGAGKTTLLSLGATALMPSGGTVTFGTFNGARRGDRQAVRRAVGWMPQVIRAIPGLTCREQVAYAGWLKGMSRRAAWQESVSALDEVELTDEADRLTSQLSGGQQRRVGLAQLLVHDAEIMLLDEPTVGLDPGQRARFRTLLRKIGARTPVIVSTHQVDDLGDLFDTVVVLNRGEVQFQGAVKQFMAVAPDSDHPAEAAYAPLIDAER